MRKMHRKRRLMFPTTRQIKPPGPGTTNKVKSTHTHE